MRILTSMVNMLKLISSTKIDYICTKTYIQITLHYRTTVIQYEIKKNKIHVNIKLKCSFELLVIKRVSLFYSAGQWL